MRALRRSERLSLPQGPPNPPLLMLTRASREALHALSGAISAAASHIAITLLAALIPSTSNYASFVSSHVCVSPLTTFALPCGLEL